jgi:plasmid stability protein
MRFAGVQNPANFCGAQAIDFNDCIAITDYNPACSRNRSAAMASITIRNLDDDIKQRLRVRAAEHGRSMEEEARDILRRVMSESASPRDLTVAIRTRVAAGARADLELPAREPMRELTWPAFSGPLNRALMRPAFAGRRAVPARTALG